MPLPHPATINTLRRLRHHQHQITEAVPHRAIRGRARNRPRRMTIACVPMTRRRAATTRPLRHRHRTHPRRRSRHHRSRRCRRRRGRTEHTSLPRRPGFGQPTRGIPTSPRSRKLREPLGAACVCLLVRRVADSPTGRLGIIDVDDGQVSRSRYLGRLALPTGLPALSVTDTPLTSTQAVSLTTGYFAVAELPPTPARFTTTVGHLHKMLGAALPIARRAELRDGQGPRSSIRVAPQPGRCP